MRSFFRFGVAAVAILAAAAGARAERRRIDDGIVHEGPVSPWWGREYSTIGVFQHIDDDFDSETTIGFEFSGPDFFDEGRRDWKRRETPYRLHGGYRVGGSHVKYNAPGYVPGTTVSTDLTLLTMGFGYDYAFKLRPSSPFVGAHLILVMPFRNQSLPLGRDILRAGLGVGGGLVTPGLLARVEYQLLEGDTDIILAGMGLRF